jgi:hypothetical protein
MTLAKQYTWSIYVIRAKAKYIGQVKAPDRKTAIERAKEKFQLSPEQQTRIFARREE